MFILMTAIVVTGVFVLTIIFFSQSHRVSRQLALLSQDIDADIKSAIDENADLEKTLIQQLIKGVDTREAVDHFRSARSALLPGAGPMWNQQLLTKQLRADAEKQAVEIKQKAFFSTAIAFIFTIFVIAGVTLAVYAVSSTSSGADQIQLPPKISTPGNPRQPITP